MCFRFRNYRTRTFSHPHPLHNPNIFFTFAYKENNKTRTINPSNYNNMIFQALTGGGYRLPLPPSMQCVARLAIPAIIFLLTLSHSSCATAKKGDEIRVYNKVGTEQL